MNIIINWMPHAKKYHSLFQMDEATAAKVEADHLSKSVRSFSNKPSRYKDLKTQDVIFDPFQPTYTRGETAKMGKQVTQKELLQGIAQMVLSTVFFIQRTPNLEAGLDSDKLEPNEYNRLYEIAFNARRNPDPLRQNRCRQLKLIDHLFEMIIAPEAGNYDLDAISKKEASAVKKIHQLLYKSLEYMFLRNNPSELYVATRGFRNWSPCHSIPHTYMRVTIMQLGHDLGNTNMLASMVNENPFILQKCLQPADLETFVSLISKEGPSNGRYLKFLNATVICGGEPIYEQQVRILDTFCGEKSNPSTISNRKRLLIETAVDRDGETCGLGFKMEKCVPFGESKIMGRNILSNGVHPLMVSWEGSDEWREGIEQDCLFMTAQSMDLSCKEIEQPRNFRKYLQRIKTMREDLKDASSLLNKMYTTALLDKSPLNDSPLKSIPRSWTKLEDIMWTLEPEEFFPVIFPDLQMTYEDFKLKAFGPQIKDGEVTEEEAGKGASPPVLPAHSEMGRSTSAGSEDPFSSNEDQAIADDQDAERKAQNIALRKFQAVKCLAEAYVAQITLFANMCYGRNYRCISPLCKQFSFSMCLAGTIHPRYPSQLKAAFAALLINLWVDRLPHDRLLLTSTIRYMKDVKKINVQDGIMIPAYELSTDHPIFKSLKSEKEKQSQFYSCLDHNKFWLLEQAIIKNLDETQGKFVREMVHRNALTLTLLKGLTLLCDLGFVRSTPKIQKLANKILLSLDGRDDIDTIAEQKVLAARHCEEDGAMSGLLKAFAFNSLENALGMGLNLEKGENLEDEPVSAPLRSTILSKIITKVLVGLFGEEEVTEEEIYFSILPEFPKTIVKRLPKGIEDIYQDYGLRAVRTRENRASLIVDLLKNADKAAQLRYKPPLGNTIIEDSKQELLNTVFQFEQAVMYVMISQILTELQEGKPLFQRTDIGNLEDVELSDFWREKYDGAGPQLFLTNYGVQVFRSIIRGNRARINRRVSLCASSTVPIIATFMDSLMYKDGTICEGALQGLILQFRFVL